MKNLNKAIILAFFSQLCFAQVHINVTPGNEVPSAMLQIDATDKGVALPYVPLTSTTDNTTVNAPKDGLLVYNVNSTMDVTPGYYYYHNNAWHPIGKINNHYIFKQPIDLSILGYTPDNTGIIADNSSGDISGTESGEGDNVRYNKLGCMKWDEASGGNGHTYCAYKREDRTFSWQSFGDGPMDWETAFNFAKSRGGYLLTLTSDAEREWVQTNIITAKSLNSNIWMGYNKFQSRYIPLAGNNNDSPFNRYRYKWITGEKWVVNWENPGGATVQHNFRSGEPSLVNENGCVYLTTDASRTWDDTYCSDTNGYGSDHLHVIVEFQDSY